uniref:PDZ domain-containing protein n=1 Tax=Nothobranchius furzeri TaxID=105023 RepID=A0A8C6PVR5_NOTFU
FHTLTRTVQFPGDRGPLGIHVIPYVSSLSGRTLGLNIKGIEENSRTMKENLFKVDESIVQINDVPLQDKTFAQSQEVFRQAMSSSSVRLEVLPAANKPRYEKSLIGQLFTGDGKDSPSATMSPMMTRSRANALPELKQNPKVEIKQPEMPSKTQEPVVLHTRSLASPTPPAAVTSSSPTPRMTNQSPVSSKNPGLPALSNVTNTKGGKRMKIDLKKGLEGLGFTVVTRDSTVHGPGPILVKSILPRGAAIKDGRLQPGDRILEVNGVDMTGRSQEELVAMLRSTKQGESVSVVVARSVLPGSLHFKISGSLICQDAIFFPVSLPDSVLHLKGNKSKETGEDLGIFIKSIIHGGAAYKDGRLCVNDQMIAVNGESLLGHSNHSAMETLRRSMSSEGNARGTIQLVVLLTHSLPHAHTCTYNQRLTKIHAGHPFMLPIHTLFTLVPVMLHMGYNHHRLPEFDPFCWGADEQAPPPTAEHSNPPPQTPTRRPDLPPSLQPQAAKQQQRCAKTPWSPSTSHLQVLFLCLIGRSSGGALGPTLGLVKSSSLESLQTAMSEANHNRVQAQVPIHRPRPHMVRGRGCNQSFRIAIDKSYEGPSEDDDDLSEYSSGNETPELKFMFGKHEEVFHKGRLSATLNRLKPELGLIFQRAVSLSLHVKACVCKTFSLSFRRDLYDYPTHRGPVPRDQVPPYPGQYQDPPVSSNAGRSTLPQSQQPPSNACYHPSAQQHRAALRQDVPPSPTTGTRGRPYNDADKERHYRQASPGRYIDSDRYPKESPGGYQYGDKRGAEPRRKNVLIDAV